MLRAGIKKFNFLLELLEKSRKTLMSQHLARVAKDLAKKEIQIRLPSWKRRQFHRENVY
jgi:hypothetical protein